MLTHRFVLGIVSVVALGLDAGAASAQDYPSRPIRILVSPPGGGNDLLARLVGQGMTANLGWTVIVENRPTPVLPELLMRSAPDGYSMLVAAGSFTIGPLFENVSFNVGKDFLPISLVASSPSLLAVHPSMPIKSVKELMALAKARPGELNFATGGTGAANHLPAELFKYITRLNLVRVNYKGAGPAMNGLLSGEVHMMFASANTVYSHIQAGRLRGLASTSAKPSELIPDLPSIAESGVPGYDYAANWGFVAPAKTPPAIINRLNQEIVRVIRQPDSRKRIMATGTDVVGTTAEEYYAVVAREQATWTKIIKEAGLGK